MPLTRIDAPSLVKRITRSLLDRALFTNIPTGHRRPGLLCTMVSLDGHLPRILQSSDLEHIYRSTTHHLPDAIQVLRPPGILPFSVEPSIVSMAITFSIPS